MRSGGRVLDPTVADQIATTGLRVGGTPPNRVKTAAAEAQVLLEAFEDP